LRITWTRDGHRDERVLSPGDSCYVAPLVPMALSSVDGGRGRALLLRIGGAATTDVRFALATMADRGIDRYVSEDRMWYSAGSAVVDGAGG
jgi:methylphosphonate synthase